VPDEEAAKASYDEAGEGGYRDGPQERYLKVLGPQGETKWEHVPVGFRNHVDTYLCQPRDAGGYWFVKQLTHYWLSHRYPNGRIINHVEGCLFCQACQAGQNHPDPNLAKRSAGFGKRKTSYLYNALAIDFPQAHMYEDGAMRPYVLGAGRRLHKNIGNLVDTRGGVRVFCNYENFRPVRITKHKSGRKKTEVEYGAIDLDPRPLDPVFWHALANLWDLTEFTGAPSRDDYEFAINDAGLIVPQQYHQVPAQYPGPYGGSAAPPAAPPPAASPYGQPPQSPYGQPQQAPPAYQAPADPTSFDFGANVAPPQQGYPPPPPAPPMASSYQQPPAHPAQPQPPAPPSPPVAPPPPPAPAAPPPPMPTPPPVQSAPGAATPYAPTTGQAPPPPPPAAAPPPPPAAAAPPPPPPAAAPPPPPPAAAPAVPPPAAAAPPPPPPPPPAAGAQQTLEGLQGQLVGEGQK
jgi:hypothetical protein